MVLLRRSGGEAAVGRSRIVKKSSTFSSTSGTIEVPLGRNVRIRYVSIGSPDTPHPAFHVRAYLYEQVSGAENAFFLGEGWLWKDNWINRHGELVFKPEIETPFDNPSLIRVFFRNSSQDTPRVLDVTISIEHE